MIFVLQIFMMYTLHLYIAFLNETGEKIETGKNWALLNLKQNTIFPAKINKDQNL